MKGILIGILAILTLFMSISVPTLTAQTIAKANVTFAFTVEQTELPAGNYFITRLSEATLLIRSADTSKSVITQFRPEDVRGGDDNPRLVFHKYRDRYFLSQVCPGFWNATMQLPTSHLEKEVQAKMHGGAVQNAAVALR